jgi:flavin-dependent dehydrogenase
MYDAIVVGARCAGAPAAMQLARKGWRVLLVDRATFPRDIPHGHFIHRDGPKRLAAWGLLERIAGHCPRVTSFTLDLGDFPLTGHDLVHQGIAFGYAPRRSKLDHLLVEAAVEAGVELREGFTVDTLLSDDGRVTGIRGRAAPGGGPIVERAHITIGADGRHSRVAAQVGAPVYDACAAATCWYFSYWSGVADRGLEVYVLGDRMIFAFPTSDELYAIFIAWPAGRFHEIKRNVEGHFLATVDAVPELGARVRCGRREERFSGAADLPNFVRKPYGPGWALLGDAGCHKDPYMALGICDAFRDVDYLVEALEAGFSDGRDPTAALAQYERRRNDAMRDDYWQNLAGARFEKPPDAVLRIRAAVRGNPDATRQWFLACERMIPCEQ